jgi:hypothetical protein
LFFQLANELAVASAHRMRHAPHVDRGEDAEETNMNTAPKFLPRAWGVRDYPKTVSSRIKANADLGFAKSCMSMILPSLSRRVCAQAWR